MVYSKFLMVKNYLVLVTITTYQAVPGNIAALEAFRTQAVRLWLFALRPRSHCSRMPWERFAKLADCWISKPQILHLHPSERFRAKHPK